MRLGNHLQNSVAIFEGIGEIADTLPPRVTRASLGLEVEGAVRKHAPNKMVKRLLRSIDDDTSSSGKISGDMWLLADLLKRLVEEDTSFPLMQGATQLDIRQKLYGPVLRRLNLHRVQQVAAYHEAQRLAAKAEETEDAPGAVSGE